MNEPMDGWRHDCVGLTEVRDVIRTYTLAQKKLVGLGFLTVLF